VLKDTKGTKNSKELIKETDPKADLTIDSKIDEKPAHKEKVVPQFMS